MKRMFDSRGNKLPLASALGAICLERRPIHFLRLGFYRSSTGFIIRHKGFVSNNPQMRQGGNFPIHRRLWA